MSSTGKDINTTLNYEERAFERPFFYGRPKTETDKHYEVYRGEMKSVDVSIKDGRGLGLSLDENSFQLVDHVTSMTTRDFYNREKVTTTYYEEVEQLIKNVTVASHVKVFHHQVRNASKQDNTDPTDINTAVQGYAHAIHTDSSRYSAEKLFLKLTNEPEHQQGRFVYLNMWRNISEEPIAKDPLAVLDENSLISPEDFVETELYTGNGEALQYRLNALNAPHHKWYYFSQMQKNEALLFKQYDSDITQNGRICFHSAFTNPDATPQAPVRESIEVRALCYFPDHQPNTCPQEIQPSAEGEYSEDETVDRGVKKILSTVEGISAWPRIGLLFLKTELAKGRVGVENVARELSLDRQGFLGLKNLPQDVKDEITKIVLEKTNFEEVLKMNFEKVKNQVSFSIATVSVRTTAFVSLASVAVGFGLCLLLKSKLKYF